MNIYIYIFNIVPGIISTQSIFLWLLLTATLIINITTSSTIIITISLTANSTIITTPIFNSN